MHENDAVLRNMLAVLDENPVEGLFVFIFGSEVALLKLWMLDNLVFLDKWQAY